MNRVVLLLASNTNDSLTQSDSLEVVSIAFQCPDSGGEAVYQARAFLRYFGSTDTFDIGQCNQQQSLITSNQEVIDEDILKTKHINAFPNPVTNILRFEGVEMATEIRVYNASGKLVLRQEDTGKLYTSNLTAGLYSGVLQSEGEFYTFKFIKK